MQDSKEVTKKAMTVLGMSLSQAAERVEYLSSLPMRKAMQQPEKNQKVKG